jgi:hypothetical protein
MKLIEDKTKKNEPTAVILIPENTFDAMNIGIIREKLSRKGIPIKLSFDLLKKSIESITVETEHIIDLII